MALTLREDSTLKRSNRFTAEATETAENAENAENAETAVWRPSAFEEFLFACSGRTKYRLTAHIAILAPLLIFFITRDAATLGLAWFAAQQVNVSAAQVGS